MNKLLIVTAALIASTNALAFEIVSCTPLNDAAKSVQVTYVDDHSERHLITVQVNQITPTKLGHVRLVADTTQSSSANRYNLIREFRDDEAKVIGQCPTALNLRNIKDPSDAKDKSDH